MLLITHRLTTAQRADVICVMSGGRIVESGTHADLLEAGGLYARAWASQTDKGSNLTNRGSSGGRLFT